MAGIYISDDGRVYSKVTNKWLSQFYDKDGYCGIALRKEVGGKQKTYKVHRLVAEAFIPNIGNLSDVNHKDGVKDNNVVSNLEWLNTGQNTRHAIATGLKVYNKPTLGLKWGKTSSYRGVSVASKTGRYVSSMTYKSKKLFCRSFSTELEAAKFYDSMIDFYGITDRPRNFERSE